MTSMYYLNIFGGLTSFIHLVANGKYLVANATKPPNLSSTDDYIRYEFTVISKNGIEMPQCVICYKTLSNDAIRPTLGATFIYNSPRYVK